MSEKIVMGQSVFQESRWWRSHERWRSNIPVTRRTWLLDAGSLTARLRTICGAKFAVRVLSQYWGKPLRSEQRDLGCERGPWSFIREVYLQCDRKPIVFARTVVPATTLNKGQRRLLRLGTKPLGELLFRDRQMERDGIEVTYLMPGDVLFHRALGPAGGASGLWGRRCVFRLNGQPLLVNEIFLPNLFERADINVADPGAMTKGGTAHE